LETDFLKDSAPINIRYDVYGMAWHDICITIPCTRQNTVLILARTAKIFSVKIKNPKVKTGLIPQLSWWWSVRRKC